MPAAELLIVCSLVTACLPARIPTELLENPGWFVIDKCLVLGLWLLKAARIAPVLFPASSPKGQTPQNVMLPGIKYYQLKHVFAVINTFFSFPTGLALCVSPHCNALLHLCHYWHAGKILALILTVSSLVLSRRVGVGYCLCSSIDACLRRRHKSSSCLVSG